MCSSKVRGLTLEHSRTLMCGTLTIANATMRVSNPATNSSSLKRCGPVRHSVIAPPKCLLFPKSCKRALVAYPGPATHLDSLCVCNLSRVSYRPVSSDRAAKSFEHDGVLYVYAFSLALETCSASLIAALSCMRSIAQFWTLSARTSDTVDIIL